MPHISPAGWCCRNHIFLSCLCKQCRPSLSWLRFLLSSLFSILLLLPFYTSSYFSLSSFSSSGFSLHSCSVWKQNQNKKRKASAISSLSLNSRSAFTKSQQNSQNLADFLSCHFGKLRFLAFGPMVDSWRKKYAQHFYKVEPCQQL